MFEQFRNKIPLDDEHWQRYTRCFTRMEIPAKTVLLSEGEVSNKLYLIEKGCLRASFHQQGKDITFQFFFENGVVASIESFRKNTPSPVNIESIEPSVIWWISKKALNAIIDEIKEMPVMRDLFINAIFERTFDYMRHSLSSIKDTPQQRYLELLQERPQLVKRIPQHYIASYLGITTVHLSRIKSKLAKEKF